MEDEFQLTPSLRGGQVLAGTYRVGDRIGVGDLGSVFAAEDLRLGSQVAVKCLRLSLFRDAEAVARFVREARMAVEVNNVHVARIFDVGTLMTGAPYVVMELLSGPDLRTWLLGRYPAAVSEVVDCALQVCEGLAAAHARGLVHRHLGPANLCCIEDVDRRLVVKISDFGMCGYTGRWLPGRHGMTDLSSPTSDSVHYLSPEQVEGSGEVDARADLWAMGVLLHDSLALQRPLRDPMGAQVLHPLPAGELDAPRLAPEIPEALEAVIHRCLARDPSQRYSDVAELALALLPFGSPPARVSVEHVVDILGVAGRPPAEVFAPAVVKGTGSTSRRRPSRRIPLALLATLTFLLAGAWGLSLGSLRSPSAGHPPATPSRSPVGVAAFVVPNSATDNFRRPSVVSLEGQASTQASSQASNSERRVATSRPERRLADVRALTGAVPSGTRSPELASPLRRVAVSSPPAPPRLEPRAALSAAFVTARMSERQRAAPARPRVDDEVPKPASPACDPSLPSFELDDQGRKHFKPECFLDARR